MPTEHGLVPKGQGWFVVNACATQWWERTGRGVLCEFEGAGFEGATDFLQLGINLTVLGSGEPMAMYHWETDQEDFLVLAGEALAIVEGEERPLHQWDFVIAPRDEPCDRRYRRTACVVLAVGARVISRGWTGVPTPSMKPRSDTAPVSRARRPRPPRRTPGSPEAS